MAKTKATKQTRKVHTDNSQMQEKLKNKSEAIRRALAKLGNRAMPAEIQDFIKTDFGVEMTTKVISVYKSKLVKKSGKKRKPGRKPKEAGAVIEPVSKPAMHETVPLKDMRTVKEISNRLGPALRILKYEGLSSDDAVAWVEDRLQALKYTEFSDRLTDNGEELQRVIAFAVDAVWKNNGSQQDLATSEAKLKAAVVA
jgi:hypothetical protein